MVPDGTLIAFVAIRPGSNVTDIWVIRPDGTGRRPITSAISSNSTPAWSPDSTKVVYQKDYFFGHDTDLYTVSVNGGPETLAIAHNWPEGAPSWQR